MLTRRVSSGRPGLAAHGAGLAGEGGDPPRATVGGGGGSPSALLWDPGCWEGCQVSKRSHRTVRVSCFVPFRPTHAPWLLAHKIQSPQEREALYALTVSAGGEPAGALCRPQGVRAPTCPQAVLGAARARLPGTKDVS